MSDSGPLRPRRKVVAPPSVPAPAVLPALPAVEDDAPVLVARHYDRVTQTVLRLNLAHAEVQRDLQDCQSMHRRVMRMFAHVNAPRDVNEILYRIDRNGPHWDVIVQSTAVADVRQLPVGYMAVDAKHREQVQQHNHVLSELEEYESGQQLLFGLVANVSKRDNVSRKRISVHGFAEQRAWLMRKGADHGFAVVEDATALLPLHIASETALKGNHRNGDLFFEPVRFSGIIEVTNPVALLQAVVQGIGSAKAYGCGLLTLRKL